VFIEQLAADELLRELLVPLCQEEMSPNLGAEVARFEREPYVGRESLMIREALSRISQARFSTQADAPQRAQRRRACLADGRFARNPLPMAA
jgi:hypothetical protein